MCESESVRDSERVRVCTCVSVYVRECVCEYEKVSKTACEGPYVRVCV